jgi:uncharacterized protein YcbK (DUF882 family)
MDEDSSPESGSASHPAACPCCRLISRRTWFRAAIGVTAAIACTAAATPVALAQGLSERRIRILSVNTQESFDGVYWRDGRYLPPALASLNRVLRDHRMDEATHMDPELFDLLHAVARQFHSDEFFHVISAYRTPETNRAKVLQSRRVAKNSQHMEGRACDLKLPGIQADGIARAAISMGVGGVGLYRRDGFVHLDTGEPRTWGAVPGSRQRKPRRTPSRAAQQPQAGSRQRPTRT